jgi:hypothetical protein
MTGAVKNGWLLKKSSGVFSKWQNRLLELDATGRGMSRPVPHGRSSAPVQ